MASSGTVYTTICPDTTFKQDGTTYTIREARWYVSWSAAKKSNGTTTVSYTVWVEKKSQSPSIIETGCTISISAVTGTIVSGGNTSLTFTKTGRKVCSSDGSSRVRQQTTSDDGAATYSFDINHTNAGAAKFKIAISANINGNTVSTDGTGECTLDTNKPHRTLTLVAGDAGVKSFTGGGSKEYGSSASATATANTGYYLTKYTGHTSSGATGGEWLISDKPSTHTDTWLMNADRTITVHSDRHIYSIKYVNVPSSYSAKEDYSILSDAYTPPNPSKNGYTFTGWTVYNGSTKKTSSTIPKGSTGEWTFTAGWRAHTYTVKYNGNGHTSGSTSNSSHTYDVDKALSTNGYVKAYTVTYNGNGGTPTASTSTASYTMSGWAKTATGSKAYNPGATVSNLTSEDEGTVNLYAVWTGGSTKLVSASRTGYNFAGWYDAASGGTKVGNADASYTPGSAKTVYAHWTAKKFTVTFNKNGGSTPNPATKSVTYNSTYGTLPTITRDGYQFEGWYTSASGGTKVTSSTKVTITADQTLYAHWTAYTLTINYTAGGGVQGSGSSYTLPHSNTVSYGAVYNSGDGLYNAIKTFKLEKTGYHLDTGKEWKTSTGTILSDVTDYTPAQLAAAEDKDLKVSNVSITVTPNWIADTDTSYKVKHWKQKVGAAATQSDANYTAEIETKYGTTGANTAAAAKTFTGFTLSSTITQKKIAADGSTVIDIYYTRNSSYKLTLSKGNGIETVSGGGSNKQYGASISVQSTNKAGYTFSKWTSSVSSVVVPNTNSGTITMPPSDLTLTASATANKNTPYVVKHWKQKLDATSTTGGTANYSEVTADRQSLTGQTDADVTPNVKSYTGFIAPSKQTVTIKGDGTTVVNYYYIRDTYTVSLTPGTGVASVTGDGRYKYGANVTVKATMATGYSWSSWSGDKSSTNIEYSFTMPANNIALTANSTADGFTVTYVGQNGKQTLNPASVSNIVVNIRYDAQFTVKDESNAFYRTGYKFLGWSTAPNSKIVDTSKWVPGNTFKWDLTNSVTLYAVWKSKGVLYVDTGTKFVPYTIWIDSGSTTGGPNNNGWYQYTAWLDTGDTSQGTNGWVQLGSLPD